MDPFLFAPTLRGRSGWSRPTAPDTAVPSGVADEAVAPADASTASRGRREVKVADGYRTCGAAVRGDDLLWMRT